MKAFLSKNKFLLGFFPLVACNGVSVGTAGIAVTLYAVHMGATPAQIGMIRGFESLGILSGVFLMGLLVDQMGPRRVFITGGLLGGAGYLLVSFAQTPSRLMVAVGVIGFFVSSRMVSMNSVFMARLKTIGHHKSGWYRASHSVGFSFIGPLLGGALAKGVGYHLTFQVISLLFFASILLAAIVLKDEKTGKGETPGFFPQETWNQIRILLKNKRFIQVASTEALITATMSCFNTFVVVMALEDYGLSQQTAAVLVALHGIVLIASLFLLGRLLARMGSRFFYFTSLFLGLAALFLLGGFRSLPLAVVGLLLLAISLGMLTVVNYSSLSEIPGERGKMAGVYGLFSVSGMALGPFVGGFIGGAFGLRAIFLGLAPLFALLGASRYRERWPEKALSLPAPSALERERETVIP
jgi:MFS family permease